MAVLHSSDPIHASEEIEGLKENKRISESLSEIAQLLEDQHAADFRVRAYRAASKTVGELPSPIRDLLEHDGIEGLIALPTIGRSIANLIESYLRLGRMTLRDRLRGESNAEHFFTTMPGIGAELSHRLYDYLHVETMAELYVAARQGRLKQVPGLGQKRIRAIMDSLAQRFGDSIPNESAYPEADHGVPVSELLGIDAEYRTKAKQNELEKVAPSKFNPAHDAWLPVLHTEREGRHYTAMFSNTARAHELGQTNDWVVIYRDDADAHGRWTVITSSFGKLKGNRIIRGREDECLAHFRPNDDVPFREAGHPPYPELPVQWEEEQGRFGVHG